MRLDGQVAIITGVSHAGQVGFALASALAREGAMLTICSRTPERVLARAQELLQPGAQVVAISADLTTEEGAQSLIQQAQATYGHIDILVNLAGGLTKYMPSAELSLADWDYELNNNLRSTFLCIRAVWPVMKGQNGGKNLNFSRAGRVQRSNPMMASYNCGKTGVEALA